ncbi:MAG: hypothetical protein NTU51_01015 [Bacteroidetes bacterium]|nr:hypothetical protein [Bacteroidota bacterium]
MTSTTFHLNPFPGIRSYEIEEDELFFGREKQIAELIERLSVTRFLAIVGSSGCGKSSLIRAGLIPALIKKKTMAFSADWKVTILKPGDDPVRNLALAFGGGLQQSERLLNSLRSDPDGLINCLKEQNSFYNHLLVIDQFEELFRFINKQNNPNAPLDVSLFIQLILRAVRQSDIPVYVVLSMRTDFLDGCTEFRELSEIINRGYYLVPRMNAAERRMAITGPIQFKGASISEELVDRILCDIGNDPDQLPIMQHALMRTWNFWTVNRIGDQPIGMDHYKSVGMMQEALSIHLEEVFNELRDQKSKMVAEKIFKALTDTGNDNRGTRRPAPLSELCTLAEAREDDVIRVIDSFREPGRAFLMPPNHVRLNSESIIDISHESIMRVWKRLRKWVDEENQSAQLYLRLSQSAGLYQTGKTGLWVNPELQLALQWKEQNKPNATWALRYNPAFERAMTFLEYSRKESELAIAKKENQQKRNLKQAKSFAVILGAASIISILFLIISLNLRFKAEASSKEALEKQKLALAESKRTEVQRSEAILQKRISDQQQQIAEQEKLLTEQQRLYAVKQQVIAQDQTKVAVKERQKADTSRMLAVQARDEADNQKQEAVSQKTIAEKERIKAEESEKNTKRLRLLSVARSMAIQAAQIDATLKQDDLPALLALQAFKMNKENGGIENEPDIYSALSQISDDPLIVRAHGDAVRAISLFPDQKTLVSAGDDGKILLWNTNDMKAPPTPAGLPKGIKNSFRSVAVTSDGNFILAGTFQGKLYIWQADKLSLMPRIITAHSSVLNTITICPAAQSFVTGGADGQLFLWTCTRDVFNKTRLDSVPAKINAIVFNPKGETLVYACSNGELRSCPVHVNGQSGMSGLGGKPPVATIIFKSADPFISLAFSPDGKNLAAGDSKGTIRIWKTSGMSESPELLIGRHSTGITCLAYSPDGKVLASCGYDGMVKFGSTDASNGKFVTAGRNELWAYGLVYTAHGGKLVSCSADKTIRLFSCNCEQMASALIRKPRRNLTADEWNKYAGSDIPYQKTVPELP